MRFRLLPQVVLCCFAALWIGGCAKEPTAETPVAEQAAEEKPASPAGYLPGRVTRIMLGDLFALQQSGEVLMYDVRPAFFHSLGHIPGSKNWPKRDYEKQLSLREGEIRAAAAAEHPVVLYCTDLACPDALVVATRLAARGHHIRVLEGGWDAWKAGGLPGS